jgi:hypothetical protein
MYKYDFMAGEWFYTCKACSTDLYAPTKKHLEGNHWIHTHSRSCIGGY